MGMIAVIGGGPAGLRAAEVAATAGAVVTVFDSCPSVGRKFLVAGGGGLNLTKSESRERFVGHYSGPTERWRALIDEFDVEALRSWAAKLDVETFVASSGRVYPVDMKSAPLLRRWLHRLRERGVKFMPRHRCVALRPQLEFATPDGPRFVEADAIILALGGGSWPETGSNGAWIEMLEGRGIKMAPLRPANCGWEVAWPPSLLAEAEGQPVKNIVARTRNDGKQVAGELLITRYGLEGGAIYQLGAELRGMRQPTIEVDFKPNLSIEDLVRKLEPVRTNLLREAQQRWRLSGGAFAILSHHPERENWNSPVVLAQAVKCCRIVLQGPRPLAEAISTAGGVEWAELDEDLMLRRLPGVFAAGEMIDWEAPTGGYLMHGCFAMGTRAGRGACRWMENLSR